MMFRRLFRGKSIARALCGVIVLAVLGIILLPTPERNTTGMKTLSPHHFAVAISSGAKTGQEDHIRGLVIYPVDAAPDGRRLQYASGELFVPHGNGGAYETFVLCAELPFHYQVVQTVAPPPATSPSGVVHLIRKMNEGRSATLTSFVNVDMKYRGGVTFAWWASPRIVRGLWAAIIAAAAGLVGMGAARVWKIWATKRVVAAAEIQHELPRVEVAMAGEVVAEETAEAKKYSGQYYPVEHPEGKAE